LEDSIVAKRKPKPIRGMGIIADPDRRGPVGINRGKQEMRRATQARRLGSRSPGGFAGGGTVETDAYGKYTIARGSGAARPQKFRKNG
jgi:hypothetical protein